MVTRISAHAVSGRAGPGRAGLALLATLGSALVLSGCQSGSNPAAALGLGGGGGQQQEASTQRITAEELTAYCPPVAINSRNAVHDSYQRGGEDDASRLVWRATLADATRSCTYGGGMTNITVAAAGRVVPGPVGQAGTVSLPVRVTVYRGTEQIIDRVQNQQVALADSIGATQFVFTDPAVSIPNPTARNIRIVVGFETGGR